MKNLIVSALTVLTLIVPVAQVVKQPANKDARRGEKITSADKSVQRQQSPESEVIQRSLAQEVQIQEQNIQLLQAEERHAAAQIEEDARLVKYTKYLVWVGALQGIVFFFTLLAIRHEATIAGGIARAASANAEAARDNAAAAKASAEAVVRSERAWILVTPDLPNKLRVQASDVIVRFRWSIKNVGRTPATILETDAAAWRVKDMKTIPVSPSYEGKPLPMNNFLLVPNDSIPINWMVEPVGEPFTLEEINEIKKLKLTLFAHGFVKYLDVFGKEHTTRFCHTYIVRNQTDESFEPYLYAPPEYSKCD